MASFAYPYLRIDPARVLAPPWAWLDDPATPIPEQIVDWDHTTDLRIVRQVRIDFDTVAAALGHDPDQLRLELVLTVGTGGTSGDRQRDIWRRIELSRDNPSFTLSVELPGAELSQAVTLRTDVLMLAPQSAASPLAPKEPGLKLWGDMRTIRLEPVEPRFSILTVPFRDEFPDTPTAPWRLRWLPGDLTRDFSGSVQLYLNQDRPEFVERVSMADRPVIGAIMHQVMSQIVRVVLADDEFEMADIEEAPTSVAAAAHGWLAKAFPGVQVGTLKEQLRADPSGFEARLADLAHGGDDA